MISRRKLFLLSAVKSKARFGPFLVKSKRRLFVSKLRFVLLEFRAVVLSRMRLPVTLKLLLGWVMIRSRRSIRFVRRLFVLVRLIQGCRSQKVFRARHLLAVIGLFVWNTLRKRFFVLTFRRVLLQISVMKKLSVLRVIIECRLIVRQIRQQSGKLLMVMNLVKLRWNILPPLISSSPRFNRRANSVKDSIEQQKGLLTAMGSPHDPGRWGPRVYRPLSLSNCFYYTPRFS